MINTHQFAKKSFGQNFLKDEYYLNRIIQSMSSKTDHIIEIGPGLGDLTEKLLQVEDVTAYEVDKRACQVLKQKFSRELATKRLQLIEEDVLKNWQDTLGDRAYDLAANLPYYIASKIVLKALHDPNCKSLLVMVQKEVAQKFAADAGDKAFGALSVLTQSCAAARLLFDVPAEAFEPAPKVTSSVLLIEKTSSLDDNAFESFLKTAFCQPRKTLFKNLSAKHDKNALSKTFATLELDRTLRPHQLVTPFYHHLHDLLKGEQDGKNRQ